MNHYRLKLLLSTGICIFTTTPVAGAAELPQELIDCRALASAVERLDCYDQLVDANAASTGREAQSGAAQQGQPASVAPAAAAPAADLSQEALFGKDPVEVRQTVQKATGTSEIDQIKALVSSVRSSATGKAIITLDNGQVWAQTDTAKHRLADYDLVIIRRASMGSFMLNKVGSKKSIRVRRIS